MFQIKNFLDCPETLPTVANWIHAQWFANKPGHTAAGMLERMKGGRRAEVPIGLVAFDSGKPIGTVSLVAEDLEERKDLTPWVAGLLVQPQSRKTGAGSALLNEIVRVAISIGLNKIYLYTEIPIYYERLGWRILCPVRTKPGFVIMEYQAALNNLA